MILLQFLVIGLGAGALYALTAQGLVTIYRGSGIVNFAQGAIGMVGAYVYYKLRDHDVAAAPSFGLGVAASVVLGVVAYVAVIRQLRHASSLVRLVSTLAVLFLLVAIGTQLWGSAGKAVTGPLPNTPREIFSDQVVVPESRLWLVVIAVAVTGLLWAGSRFTSFGRSTQAAADNPVAAAAIGLSPDRIASANWAIGSALAGITAILLSPILVLSVAGLSFVVLKGLAAALVGGFRSYWWTLVGALAIGVAEAEISHWQPGRPGLASAAPFVLIIGVLVVAGRNLPLRGELLDRLPRLGVGIVNIPAILLASVVAVGLIYSSPSKAVAVATTVGFALVCLSVVVVTGFVGQVTLGQMALAGFAAWVAGRLTAVLNVPFPVAVLAGLAATVVLAVLFAFPAVRTRGVNLAIITFGLAVVVYRVILIDPDLTGGMTGTPLHDPHVAWLSVNPTRHPERYALLCVGLLIVFCVAVANLRRSATGRKLVAVRNNERGAAALGINVATSKLFAFAIAGAIAAMGGILFTYRQSFASYVAFNEFASIQLMVYTVIGGVGYVVGAIIGGLMVPGGVPTALLKGVFGSGWFNVVAGAALLVNLLVYPNGLAAAPSLWDWVRRRRRSKENLFEMLPATQRDSTRIETSLRVEDLVVRFGGVVALDRVSCEVRSGEVLGVIGPNGAGKTTLIDAVTGFNRPSAGRIVLDDTELTGLPAHRRAGLGLGRSFQSLELFDDLTVLDNIAVGCEPASLGRSLLDLIRPARRALSPRAVDAIHTFGLEGELNALPEHIPYGHRRLVAIARAVASGSPIVLLDEPAAGLAAEERRELGELIRRMADDWGLAVLLVEHDVDLVMSVSDRILALDFGKVVCVGDPDDVLSDPKVRASYLGKHPEAAA